MVTLVFCVIVVFIYVASQPSPPQHAMYAQMNTNFPMPQGSSDPASIWSANLPNMFMQTISMKDYLNVPSPDEQPTVTKPIPNAIGSHRRSGGKPTAMRVMNQVQPVTPSPPPTATCSSAWSLSPPPKANDVNVAQEVFFKTLMQSVKEANRCNAVKSSGWKNPMLYKTTLCDHWRLNGQCRFGVGCWYAHGQSDLRFVPRSSQLPTPSYIHEYLSYLGLPKSLLDSMINLAYEAARASVVPDATPLPDEFDPNLNFPRKPINKFRRSASCSAIRNPLEFKPNPAETLRFNHDIFKSSVTSEGDWDLLRSMLNDASKSLVPPPAQNPPPPAFPFEKSFRIFGDSYPLKPSQLN